MKINFKKLLLFILITFLIGNIFTFFTMDPSFYKSLNKPFNLPGIVFPIVWSILFLLMSISLYIVSENTDNKEPYIIYFFQLILNSLWTLFFFGLKMYLFSFIWIIIILIAVINMILDFYKINKLAGLLQLPYVIWLLFAGYLNYMIYYLN